MHISILTEPKGYSPKAIATLKKIGAVYSWHDAVKKPAVLNRADILVVKLGMRISKEVMSRLPNLKIIATSTTGLNHIDLDEAEARGIKIVSLRGETKFLKTITPTAEETIGLMISLMRKLPWGFDAVRSGQWQREKYYSRELYGRMLGIIGLGRLGRIVARYGKCFGMRVLAYDPNVSEREMKRLGVEKAAGLGSVFKKADVVSLHVLLTPETEGLIQKKHFKLMRPTAYFINTARGELTDENALLEALRKKWIAGAALDVLADEDPKGAHLKNNPLVRYAKAHDNLLIMPHLGGASFDAMARTEEFIAEKVSREVKTKSKRPKQK